MNCWAGSQNLLLEMPELYVGKLTRTVLRGKGGVTRRTTRSSAKQIVNLLGKSNCWIY